MIHFFRFTTIIYCFLYSFVLNNVSFYIYLYQVFYNILVFSINKVKNNFMSLNKIIIKINTKLIISNIIIFKCKNRVFNIYIYITKLFIKKLKCNISKNKINFIIIVNIYKRGFAYTNLGYVLF